MVFVAWVLAELPFKCECSVQVRVGMGFRSAKQSLLCSAFVNRKSLFTRFYTAAYGFLVLFSDAVSKLAVLLQSGGTTDRRRVFHIIP